MPILTNLLQQPLVSGAVNLVRFQREGCWASVPQASCNISVAFRYRARTSYIRTTAVMSMVGYMLGLGDRHGENILFDTVSGETVHVDFNCIFNKVCLLVVCSIVHIGILNGVCKN